MDIYSTANAPRNMRAAYWNTLYSTRYAQVTFRPHDHAAFEAELRVAALGPLGLARVSSRPTDIERTRRHIGESRRRLFAFLLQLQGRARFSHCGQDTVLDAGDLTLCDSAVPHRLTCDQGAELLILRADPDTLRGFLPLPERLCGRRLPADAHFADAAAALLRSLWRQLESGVPEKHGSTLVRSVLDVLSTACGLAFEGEVRDSSSVTARRIQAQRFVEAHLREQDLGPARIADALHISPRYLRMIFEGDGESVTGYILRRRLEECARQIASPLWRGHTITAIAFACGFNSAAHFTRAFRERFGTTPTDWRRRHS